MPASKHQHSEPEAELRHKLKRMRFIGFKHETCTDPNPLRLRLLVGQRLPANKATKTK
jgi:hypothetical protein